MAKHGFPVMTNVFFIKISTQWNSLFPKALPSHWPSFCAAISEERVYIDQHVMFSSSQDLTQAAIALCLAITRNVCISVHHLKRQLARIQLNHSNHSKPDSLHYITSQAFSRHSYLERHTTNDSAVIYIADQIRDPGPLHGYQMITERWRSV